MAHRVEASIEVEPDLPMPDIDPNQIQQVFVNLINNAAQAIASTGRPGRVVVRARRWLDGVAIDVVDDGPGMSEALAAQVFEPFFTTKPEGEGTGLGLSISQGIVREHGGRIMLSTEEGRGSTFTVQLPLATRPPAPTPAAGAGTPTKRLRVLVVDDEPHILHYMHATLEAWGHVPVVARNGARGPRAGRPRGASTSSSPTSGCPSSAAASSTRSWPDATPRSPPAWSSAPATRSAATRSPSSRASTAPTCTSPSASPSCGPCWPR